MAIKSISKCSGAESHYPCLKYSGNLKQVVIFTAPKTGFIVAGGCSGNEIGYWSDSWCEDSFSLATGKITLENE